MFLVLIFLYLQLVREVFSRVASKYDVMNDVMSLGAHRLWKDELVSKMGIELAAKADPSAVPRHLDVAGGTGDIAFRALESVTKHYSQHPIIKSASNIIIDKDETVEDESNKTTVVCDINPDMLAVGKSRSLKVLNGNIKNLVGFVEGNAEKLPFPSNSFDIYTIAFGLRNVTNKNIALDEAYRVLKPGGKILIMEFSHVDNVIFKQIYDQYSMNVIPKLGELIANDHDSYQYLVESIRRFPKQEELLQMIQTAGFVCTNYTNLTLGIVAIHSGFKL